MTIDARGWSIGQFLESYRSGLPVADAIDAVLRSVDELPDAVLMGVPLRDRARRHAERPVP